MTACSSVPVAAPASEAPEGAPVRTVAIIARKWEFDPAEVRVRQGEIVAIRLSSEDVTHGFKIKQIDLNVTLTPGEPVEVRLYARDRGVVPFVCSHFCGLGHFWMDGEIIIE